jgi:hypothetical protein
MANPERYPEIEAIIGAKNTKVDLEDETVDVSIRESEQYILNYCRIPVVPVALNYTWANIALDLALYLREKNLASDEIPEDELFDPSDVATIAVGDTRITLGDKYRSNERSRTLQIHQPALDRIVYDYLAILQQFRKTW